MCNPNATGGCCGTGFPIGLYSLLFLLLIAIPVNGSVFEPRAFADPTQAARYKTLLEELRCLVCQNQSLADSNAELAADLRQEVYDMVREGADEEAVKAFMVDRYSRYVLYRPPVTATTLLLWIGPLLFVLMGFVFLILWVRRPTGDSAPAPFSETEKKRIGDILGN